MSDTLVNMFHGRIKYPWQKAQEEAAALAAHSSHPGQTPNAPKDSGTSGLRTVTPAQGTGSTVVRLPRPGDKS